MSSLILTSAELVVLVVMLGGLVRIRSMRAATAPLELAVVPLRSDS